MFSILRAVIDRFKALFLASAALELEADLIALGGERKADLLRRADQYEKEGLNGIAQQIRQQAEALAVDRPFASVQAAIAHLHAEPVPAMNPGHAPSPLASATVAVQVSAGESTSPRKKKS